MLSEFVGGLGPTQSTVALVGIVLLGVALVGIALGGLAVGGSVLRLLGSPVRRLFKSETASELVGSAPDPALSATTEGEPIRIEQRLDAVPKRVDRKREQYPRAIELRKPTGFINTEGLSLGEYVGDRVILIEFWTFGCYNCQNTHSKIQRLWRKYRDDGLLVVGVHYPEFDRERDPANVRGYISETDTTYPVVLDTNGGTWDAYDQRYWPCRYLIGVDGFVRYAHAGEGAYEETERAVRQLLAERKRVRRTTS